MALRYAVATGNWSNTATWDGGTLPTATDDVFSNNFTVTIDGTFTVLSIRNTLNAALPVILAGGQFRYANGGNLTCTAAQAIFVGSTTPTLEMTLATPNIGTFNGSVLTMTNTASYIGIRLSSSGTLNLNGNYNIDNTGGTSRTIISVTSTGTLNVVGDLSSSVGSVAAAAHALLNTASSNINITGNVTAGNSTSLNGSTINTNAGTINITGNTTANITPAVYMAGSVNYNQIGNVNASTVQPAIYNITTAATISITGIITASTGAPAIYGAFALASAYSSGTFSV